MAHTPLCRVNVALDIAHQILTGELPSEEYQVADRVPTQAVQKLGECDRRRRKAEFAASSQPVCVNCDTGNEFCEREVSVAGTFNEKLGRYSLLTISCLLLDSTRYLLLATCYFRWGEPVALSLACTELHHDQSGRNGMP